VLTAAGPVRPELTSADKGKARKVIGAHPKLTRATKTVGILLVEHYNIKTHRCDPSLGRLARLAAVNERTVRRALDALRQVGIRSDRHGGRYLTNGYIFDWNLIRFLESNLNLGFMSGGAATSRTTLSLRSGQSRQHPKTGVSTKTLKKNLKEKPSRRSEKQQCSRLHRRSRLRKAQYYRIPEMWP